MKTYPMPDCLDEFSQWCRTQGLSENTINEYIYKLKLLKEVDIEVYFAKQNLKGRDQKVFAYRKYLSFLCRKKNSLSREDLMDALDTIKPKKKRGNGNSDKKYSIPKGEWSEIIRKAPNQVAKFGVWIGFNFGLRLSEIVHLRTIDINFEKKEISIREHKQGNFQKAWNPKYNRERQVPFTKDQGKIIKRWINEIRPSDLIKHDYLLFNVQGVNKNRPVQSRTFQNWLKVINRKIHPHILRYSFATHWYETTKDIKFVSDMLGHANVSTTSDYLRLGQKESMKKARKYFEE